MYVFSSGLVAAQKLLLCCTNHGNLLPLITDFFDVSCGEKFEKESYVTIAKEVNVPSAKFLFLTDRVKEAIAAYEAGMFVAVVKRPDAIIENVEKLSPLMIPIIESFDKIKFS